MLLYLGSMKEVVIIGTRYMKRARTNVGLQPAAEVEPAVEASSNEPAQHEPAPSPTTPENLHDMVIPVSGPIL